MKFLLDSCVSGFAVKDLREAGFDVQWIPEKGKDPGDDAIIKKAFDEDMVLVTLDKDFGEIETHRTDIEKKALITADRYRVRIRLPE